MKNLISIAFLTFFISTQVNAKNLLTMSEVRDFCKGWFPALVLKDQNPDIAVKRLLSNFYTEDAVLIDPNFDQPQIGTFALSQYYKVVMSKYPNWSFTPEEIFLTEKGFVLHYTGSVPGKVEFFRGVDIIELEKDELNNSFKISKLTGVYDRTPFINAENIIGD